VKSFLPLILLVVFFYMLVLRPAQKRQKQALQVADSLQVGAEVVTTGGMSARIHAVSEQHVELEIAPGVVVRFARGAVARVVPPEEPADDHAADPSAEPSALTDSSPADDEPRNTTET
jgi:preprotein translocase subunit YajC